MAQGDLVSADVAYGWLGVQPSDDPGGTVPRLVSAVSDQIARWIGYSPVRRGYTRTFSGKGGSMLYLPDRPIQAVSSVTIDGVAVPARPGPNATGFVFDESAVLLDGPVFTRGVANVTITYEAGFDEIPASIRQAALDLLRGAWSAKDRDPAITAQSAGDHKEVYGGGTSIVGSFVVPFPASVTAALQAYRRVTSG